jgi:hypothetical protein
MDTVDPTKILLNFDETQNNYLEKNEPTLSEIDEQKKC